jgi:hypothetical protein
MFRVIMSNLEPECTSDALHEYSIQAFAGKIHDPTLLALLVQLPFWPSDLLWFNISYKNINLSWKFVEFRLWYFEPEGKRSLRRPRCKWGHWIRMDLTIREIGWGVWTVSDCPWIGTSGGLLCVRWWTFGFLRQGVRYFELWHHVVQ